MIKLSKPHKLEILKRELKRQSPTETNMGEQTPPGLGMGTVGTPGLSSMGSGPSMPMSLPAVPTGVLNTQIPPLQIETAESYDKNPIRDLGSRLLQGMDTQLTSATSKQTLTPIDVVIKNEAEASQIWKIMGGYDSVAGRLWQELSDRSKLFDNGRDYFISCYNKYMQIPEQFAKTNSREALLIKNINSVMDEKHG